MMDKRHYIGLISFFLTRRSFNIGSRLWTISTLICVSTRILHRQLQRRLDHQDTYSRSVGLFHRHPSHPSLSPCGKTHGRSNTKSGPKKKRLTSNIVLLGGGNRSLLNNGPSTSWANMTVWGFQDSPISWRGREHGHMLSGENMYSFFLWSDNLMPKDKENPDKGVYVLLENVGGHDAHS